MNPFDSRFSSKSDTLPDNANIVIVGGGLSGLEVAKELDSLGAAGILVLEAGPTGDLAHINSVNDVDTALRLWLDPNADKHFWCPWTSKSEPHFSSISASGLKRRLGGRSLCWHGVTLPIEPWALCEPWWPRAIIDDLTKLWHGGPSLYARVSADLEAWRTEKTSPSVGPPPLTIGQYKLSMTPQAVRNVVSNKGQLWEAYSPLHYWLSDEGDRRLRRSASTVILPEIEVLGIKVGSGRATGVTVRPWSSSISHEIKCNAVVLTAGTIENTRLAIQALSTTGAVENTCLGGLVDHIVQGFVVTMNPACLPQDFVELGTLDSFYFTHCANHSRSNLFARMSNNQSGAFVLDVWVLGEQLPSSQGVVQCDPTGDEPWKVFVQASLAVSDQDVLEAQRDELQSFWTAFCNMINRPSTILEFHDFDAPKRTLIDVLPGLESAPSGMGPITWSGPLGSEYHEGCTLPLGVLLNETHEFMNIKSLFAGGPSTFPRMGAANPSMTSLALARRLAAFLPG